MINIVNFKVLKGFEHWKSEFNSFELQEARALAGVKVVTYGWDSQSGRVYIVQDIVSMLRLQQAMEKRTDLLEKAGVDMATMEMIPLKD